MGRGGGNVAFHSSDTCFSPLAILLPADRPIGGIPPDRMSCCLLFPEAYTV